MHEAKMDKIQGGDGGSRVYLQAPSLFGLEHCGTNQEIRQVGYVWGQLDVDERIRVWPYILNRSGNRFVFDSYFKRAFDKPKLKVLPFGHYGGILVLPVLQFQTRKIFEKELH